MSTEGAGGGGADREGGSGAGREGEGVGAAGDDGAGWSRLDARMLLVHPIRELIRFLPLLLVAFVAGRHGGEPWWTYMLSGLGVLLGLSRWFTTRYRITPTHVQLKRGLLNRRRSSVPRERIRSVEARSTLLHRMVRLSVVSVGTAAVQGADDLTLDAVAARDVPRLRAELLRHARPVPPREGPTGEGANISGWRPAWVRYAPFTLTGVGALAAVVAFAFQAQFLEGGALTRIPAVRSAWAWATALPAATLVVEGGALLIVLASLVAMARYVLSFWNFTLSREGGRGLQVSHGLLSTRHTSLDEDRLRGVQLGEPLSLRLVGAATAHAVMTGLGRSRGVALLAPPGPEAEALRVAEYVLGERAPLECALARHGPRAVRRRYTRAGAFVLLVAVAVVAAQLAGVVSPQAWWIVAGLVPALAALAWDRGRALGHTVLPGVLVGREGSLVRGRWVLRTEGVIGWTIKRSFFQRRGGLATLVATTAAGRHRYRILDLPMEYVWPIVERVSSRP